MVSQIIYSKHCRICSNHQKMQQNTTTNPVYTSPMPKPLQSKVKQKNGEWYRGDIVCCHSQEVWGTGLHRFISNDDASTRKLLTNSATNPLLPTDFVTPTFLADLNDRIKCLAKPVFKLASLSKKISRVTRADALKVKRNYAWYFKSCIKNKQCTFKQFKDGSRAPLHHHFGEHHWCSAAWCWAKKLDEMEDMMEGDVEGFAYGRCDDVVEAVDDTVQDEEEEDHDE